MVGNSTSTPVTYQPRSLRELAFDAAKQTLKDDKKSREIARKELRHLIPRAELVELCPIIEQPRPGQLGAMQVAESGYRIKKLDEVAVQSVPCMSILGSLIGGVIPWIFCAPKFITPACLTTGSFLVVVPVIGIGIPAIVGSCVAVNVVFYKAAHKNAWYGFQ